MTRLTATQLRAFNEVLLALYDELSDPQPLESVIDLIEKLVPVSWVSVDEAFVGSKDIVHRAGRRLENIAEVEAKLQRFAHENPVIAYAQQGHFQRALKVSDFTSFREFERTAFYQEIARFLPGWKDQAALPVRLPGSSLGFALNRDRSFSSEELFLLELLQPHVERVLHRCTQYLQLTTEAPLTAREREIVHWVAEGKRDGEIAAILRLSTRTVEQHVRVCLQKLGVETRSAAAATVWRARSRAAGQTRPV